MIRLMRMGAVAAALLIPALCTPLNDVRARDSGADVDAASLLEGTASKNQEKVPTSPAPASNRRKRGKSAPEPPAPLLPPRRWNPAVRAALERLIARLGSDSPTYSADDPPKAVFEWDDVAAVHHVGEAAFYRLIGRAEFKFDDAFWKLIPDPYGWRAEVGYMNFKSEKAIVWPKDPYYGMYRKAMFGAYQNLCRTRGPRVCRAWLASLLAGFGEDAALLYMKEMIAEEELRPVGWEDVVESPGDERPVRVRIGLRPIPEMRDLIGALLKHGFDVWAFSGSNQWAAQVFAGQYGIDPSRVVGVRCRVKENVILPEIEEPAPVAIGQAQALTHFIGRPPDLVVGGVGDRDLLEYGSPGGTRLVLDSGDVAYRAFARGQGWLVQTSFLPAEAETSRP